MEGKRLLKFGIATDMVVCNASFSEKQSRLITHKSRGCQAQIDYWLETQKCGNQGVVKISTYNLSAIPVQQCRRHSQKQRETD